MSTLHWNAPSILILPEGEKSPLSIRAKALVFEDPRSRQLLDFLGRVSPSDAPVLINGESGTGKELVARYIHTTSGRKGNFVAVNCGAISETLAESELFGHEAGSFSGATGRRIGWIEEADGGTLFLDEIGDLPLPLQVKLLRVLQEGEVTRVGSRRPIAVDLRLVAATNVDIEQAVSAGNFRLDLFYRINLAQTTILPLRERPLDIMPLAEHFRAQYCKRLKRSVPMFSEAAVNAMLEYAWPGNIRELENVIHLALLVCTGPVIAAEDLKFFRGLAQQVKRQDSVPRLPQEIIVEQIRRLFEVPGESLLDDLERLIVDEAYSRCQFNQVHTASLLGITRNVMRTLLIKHGQLPVRSRTDA